MLNRAACERRVYRLATLLTGNPIAATKVITQVVDAQPDLRQLDSAHMDRLTVLRSREIPAGELAADDVPREIAKSLAALSPQQREAWVFARVYETPEREMARAMDCSVTATLRHLEQADEVMQSTANAPAAAAVESLQKYSLSLDVPAFYRRDRMIRQRARRMMLIALLVIAILAVIAVLIRFGPALLDVLTVKDKSNVHVQFRSGNFESENHHRVSCCEFVMYSKDPTHRS